MTARVRGEGGQAAVELVLVLPLVLLVALAALQVSLVARDQVLLLHAVREAARQVSLGADGAVAADAARRATALDAGSLSILTEREDVAGRRREVRVAGSYDAPTDVPLVGGLFGPVRLHASVAMLREGI